MLLTLGEHRIRELTCSLGTQAKCQEQMTQPGLVAPEKEPFHILCILVYRDQPRQRT